MCFQCPEGAIITRLGSPLQNFLKMEGNRNALTPFIIFDTFSGSSQRWKKKAFLHARGPWYFIGLEFFFLIFFYWILAPQLIIEATREINIVIITWFIKLLIPWSDWLLISPYITPFESNAKLRRIKEIITDVRIPWLLNKFSLSVLWKCIRSSVEEMNTDVKGVKSFGKMD